MPVGFNVESGADLSDKLKHLAPRVLYKLQEGRKAKTITPENPISGQSMCEYLKDTSAYAIQTSDIRAIVNHLRREKNPIGSNIDGYFFALGISELDLTLTHLKQRAAAIYSAIHGLKNSFENENGQLEIL
jgi:hypothetical protein